MDEKQTQVTEVRDTNQQGEQHIRRQEVETTSRVPASVIVARIIWFITSVIVVILTARVVLQLLGANQANGFVDAIYRVSAVFAEPFFGMFNYQPTYGSSTLEISTVVAIIVYLLVGWGIAKLVTLGSRRS